MTDEVRDLVFDALKKGRAMRTCQKEYFQTRQDRALRESKAAERAFDEALDKAANAVRLGYVPKQEELL